MRNLSDIAATRDASARTLSHAAGLGRRGVAAGGRHRRDEHHAGERDGAHARDRAAAGDRRAAARHPGAVPARGGGAGAAGRRGRRRGGHRRCRTCWRTAAGWPVLVQWDAVALAVGGLGPDRACSSASGRRGAPRGSTRSRRSARLSRRVGAGRCVAERRGGLWSRAEAGGGRGRRGPRRCMGIGPMGRRGASFGGVAGLWLRGLDP